MGKTKSSSNRIEIGGKKNHRGQTGSTQQGRKGSRASREKGEDANTKPKFSPNVRHYADAGIFLFIMVIGAVLAYALIPISFAQDNQTDGQDLADLTTNTNQVLMGSTIPECIYTDTGHQITEYHNEKVYYLLSEDIYIRTEGQRDLNLANLRGGIEKNIADLAQRLLIDGYGFLIMVETPQQDGFVIVQTSSDASASFDHNHGEKAVMDILGTNDNTAYHVKSEYFLRNLKTCTITFSMFKTSSVDVSALQGAL